MVTRSNKRNKSTRHPFKDVEKRDREIKKRTRGKSEVIDRQCAASIKYNNPSRTARTAVRQLVRPGMTEFAMAGYPHWTMG